MLGPFDGNQSLEGQQEPQALLGEEGGVVDEVVGRPDVEFFGILVEPVRKDVVAQELAREDELLLVEVLRCFCASGWSLRR